jgi:tetratricopeptide (TPR) repeat protein
MTPLAIPDQRRTSRRSALSLALFVFSLTLLVYIPVVHNEFLHWDDDVSLSGNHDFLPPRAQLLERIWMHPTHGYNGFYVPVTYTVWWVVARIAHGPAPVGNSVVLDPAAFHSLNLLFHAMAAVMAFLVLRRLVKADLPAALGALLFAIHPLQVEPVSWASTMYTPLSGLFALLAVWLYLLFADERDREDERRLAWAWCMFGLATLCFVLGLLTKPTVVVLPVIAAVIEIFLRAKERGGNSGAEIVPPGGRGNALTAFKDVSRRCAPLLLWLAIGAADAMLTRENHEGRFANHAAIWMRPIVASDALRFYMTKLVAPIDLVTDYGRTPQWVLAQRALWVLALVPVALVFAAWKLRRRAPWLLAGTAIFVIAPAATLGLVPFNYQRFSTVADRYAYPALFGAAIVVAYFVQWARGRQWRFVVPATFTILFVLGLAARAQTDYWHDTQSLFTRALEVNPTSLAAHGNLADMLLAEGTPQARQEALAHLRTAVETHPEDPVTREALGREMFMARHYREAAELYSQAAMLAPDIPNLHYMAGRSLMELNDRPAAIAAFTRTVELSPDFADAPLRLADLLADAGRTSQALALYQQILQAHPRARLVRERIQRLEAQAGMDVH